MTTHEIKNLLGSFQGELIDFCLYIYNNIKSADCEHQVECFQTLCELYGSIKSTESVIIEKTISKDQLDILTDQHGDYVNEILNSLLKKSYIEQYSSRQFYHNLWAALLNGGIITTDNEFAFAIYYIIIDRKIPYFTLEHGLQMDTQRFENYMSEKKYLIAKLRFILNHGFTQKTEEASLIVKELIRLGSYEEQVIAVVAILSTLRDEQKRLKKYLNLFMES